MFLQVLMGAPVEFLDMHCGKGDILTTPVFNCPLLSPDVIILFENFHRDRQTFSDISQKKFVSKSLLHSWLGG